MKRLTNDVVKYNNSTGRYSKFKRICAKLNVEPNKFRVMLSIYAIESYYRPFAFRIIEYMATIFWGILSVIFKIPMRNYTIGSCQLGIATICNYFGEDYYEHQTKIILSKLRTLIEALSVIPLRNTVKILEKHITPILRRAIRIYPDNIEQQLCYVGEQFNGRYYYGLTLCETYMALFHEL